VNSEKRSPLKDKPLRNPGQSLEDQLDELYYDKVLTPGFTALFFVVIALLEWVRFFFAQKPNPLLYTFAALIAVGYAAMQIRRVWPRLKGLRQGSDGEKAVGQYLERLREKGYQVFHDVIGTGFNVDHVLVGPAGVLSIETKTFSKRPGPNAKVQFNGERIIVDGLEPDRDAVIQAKAQSAWLRSLLAESTGRTFPTRPVVLFPGWYVEQGKGSLRDVWVLNPKALPDFLANEPAVLSTEDVKLASFHLSRFIRSSD
jgi:Nuclease-related domain